MPHQCVRCGKIYPAGCKELLSGCSCSGRFFFFVKDELISKALEVSELLSEEDKIELEQDILELVGNADEQPVILDFESIRATSPGKYEIDLIDLFKGDPLVIKLDEGKYVIDIPSTFDQERKKKK